MIRKRLLPAALALALAVPAAMSSCGGSAPQKSRVENAYDWTTMDLGRNVSVDTLDYYDGRVYYSLSEAEDDGTWTQIYRSAALDGSGTQDIGIESKYGSDGFTGYFDIADDGTLWYADFSYSWDEATGDSAIKFSVIHSQLDGTVISSTDISDVLKDETGVSRMVAVGGRAVVTLDKGLIIVGDNGTERAIDVDADYLDNVFIDRSGSFYVRYWDNFSQGQVVKKADLDKGTLSAAPDLPKEIASGYHDFFSGPDYDFYYAEPATGLYGCSFGDGAASEICNWINSDISFDYIQKTIVLGDGRLLVVPEPEGTEYRLYVMEKRPDDKNPEKFILTLGCVYLDSSMRSAVTAFNRASEEYRVVVKDYSYYSTSDDWEGGYNRLNQDIISGNSPDIIAITSMTPYLTYVSKGVFEPLNKYIDGDKGISRADYLDNIFRAGEIEGELYSVISAFSVQTVACRKSTAEAALGRTDIKGATVEDYIKIMDANPDARSFNYMSKEGFPTIVTAYMLDEFIDEDTGRCSFDSQAFIDLLEFGKRLPDKYISEGVNYDTVDDSFWDEIETSIIEGRTLFDTVYIGDYSDFWQTYKGEFGGDMLLIGWPTSSGRGDTLDVSVEAAISSSSKFKDQAWEFIKYLLSDESQNAVDYILPVKRSALEPRKQADLNPPKTNEYGEEIYYPTTTWIGGTEVDIGIIDKETADFVDSYIGSIVRYNRYDEKITDIIAEETSAYFSGAKTAEETAKLIQNRVQTYVSEQK